MLRADLFAIHLHHPKKTLKKIKALAHFPTFGKRGVYKVKKEKK